MSQALIIGGTSFVGRHLADKLHALTVPFVATSRRPPPGMLACDLRDPSSIAAVLGEVQPSVIFSCAGETTGSAEAMRWLHRDATEGLLHAVHRQQPHAIVVLFGSAAEYGPMPPEALPVREDAPTRPQSDYGRSKLEQTERATKLTRQLGLRVHVVRPFNLLGPGLGPQYVASSLAAQLRRDITGPLRVINGQATRDWVDVRDAVDAVVRLVRLAPPAAGTVGLFNIATGIETSVLELAGELCRLAGASPPVDAGPGEGRSGIDRSCGDATRLRAATGWQPSIDWRQSVRDLWHAAG